MIRLLVIALVICSPLFSQDYNQQDIKIVKQVKPIYPKEAKEMGLEGRVVLTFSISKSGVPYDIVIKESAHKLLDNAAMTALNLLR